MDSEVEPRNDDQPVAYDTEGRPLYYREETTVQNNDTNIATPDPESIPKNEAPDETKPVAHRAPDRDANIRASIAEVRLRHSKSAAKYPNLDLSAEEYVVIDVERSIWGLVQIWLVTLIAFLTVIAMTRLMINLTGISQNGVIVGLIAGFVCIAGGIIISYIFRQNFFIVTNERIFAKTQYSLFSYHDQSVEIEHIEDCSYQQAGFFQTVLGYGSIRLSTVGNEHTYHFAFVKDPEAQFRIVNRVVQVVDENDIIKQRPRRPNSHWF